MQAFAFQGHCGTIRAIENYKQNKSQPRFYESNMGICGSEVFYDSVYTRETKHFQIFYTLDGIHKTDPEFIDSLAQNLEKAWDLHTIKLKMKTPLGVKTTYQYKQNVKTGLYPVEVVELNFLDNSIRALNNVCELGCFGFVYPTNPYNPQESELFFENDFRYVPILNEYSIKYDSIKVNDHYCHYPTTLLPLTNQANYSIEWAKGIRVTAFHELYHAVQLRYINFFEIPNTFWLEASATGIENVGAPDVNDYVGYLPELFNKIGIPFNSILYNYAEGILFQYLYYHYDKEFDRKIWESFSQEPKEPFETHFAQTTAKKGVSADSLFHDFATRLLFTGERSFSVDSSLWINEDHPIWPEYNYNSHNYIQPSLSPFAFNFYKGENVELGAFKGKGSAALFKNGKASVKEIGNTSSLDTILTHQTQYDSIIWIFSHFQETKPIPEIVTDSTLRAYPTPWRHGDLCFTPLPLNKEFIEIRSRRGDLLWREKYGTTTHCIDESTIKSKMKPGIYRFRAGNSGKTKDILIIY